MPCDLQTPKVLVNDFEEASSIDMKEAQSDMDASVEKLGKLWLVNLRPPDEPSPEIAGLIKGPYDQGLLTVGFP